MRTRVILACTSLVQGLLAARAIGTDYRFVRVADTRDGPYFLDLARHPAINNAGSVAFWRQPTSGGGTGYYIGNGGAQNPIILDTDPALTFQALHQVSLNDTGDIAFYADSLSVGFRVYKVTSAGTLSIIAASGGGSFSSIDDYPIINNSGAVAFKAGPRAFVNAGSGNLEYYGPTTPATGVGVATAPFLSNAGQLALSGSYGLATGGNAYLRGSGGPPTIIADGATTISSFGSKSSVNDSGLVVFGTTTSDPGGEVIYTGMGFNVLTKIADNTGPYADVAMDDGGGAGGTPAINNSGTVAFVARLTSGHYGIFTGADPSTTRIVQAGSTMFGRTLTDSIGGLGREAINDAGEITFSAGLFDGSSVSSLVIKAVPFTPMKWNHDGDGSWSVSGNWLGPVPNAHTHDANFTDAIHAPRTVTVDGAFTVGSINFDNTNSYTIAGAGTITLDDSYQAHVTVLSGSHVIHSPVSFARDAVLTIAADPAPGTPALQIDSPNINFPNVNLVAKSGPGTLRITNVRTHKLDLSAGTVQLLAGIGSVSTSKVDQLNVAGSTGAWTSTFDAADSALIIDYTSTTPLPTVLDQLKKGYAGSAWTGSGITSSTAATAASSLHKTALGYAEATELFTTFPASFAGMDIDNTAVLVRYAYYGDANLDRTVNTIDFNILVANFSGTGKRWTQADFNYNGTTDTIDFNLLASNFALALPGSASAPVPEPASIVLAALAAVGLLQRRRRC